MYLIPGNPVPLARPRLGRQRVFDSQKLIKSQVGIVLAYQHGKKELYNGPLHVDVSFFMAIPQSLSHKKRLSLEGQYHYKKLDLDNLIKFILDVANGIIFADDCLIAMLTAKKLYADYPRTEFTVRSL